MLPTVRPTDAKGKESDDRLWPDKPAWTAPQLGGGSRTCEESWLAAALHAGAATVGWPTSTERKFHLSLSA